MTAEINIIDDDGSYACHQVDTGTVYSMSTLYWYIDQVVGFEKTVYYVSEDSLDGVVELCAVVYTAANSVQCPIPFRFIVLAEVPSRGMWCSYDML